MGHDLPQTIGYLQLKAIVTDVEIVAALKAYLADPACQPFRFASGHSLDVAAAVKEYEPARLAVVDPDRTEKFRRTMVRTAVILAVPVQR